MLVRYRMALPGLALALSGLALSGLHAQPPQSAGGSPEITAPEVLAHIKYLASDELKGRGSGTPENDRAAEYIAGKFRAYGLKPAGDHGFFQSFPVFTGVKLGRGNELTLGRSDGSDTLRVEEDFQPVVFSQNASAEAPLVFAGYGISKPDLGWDDYKGLDVRAKIVVVLRHTPDGNDNGKLANAASIMAKTMTAREKGAAGILLLTGPTNGEENLGLFQAEGSSTDCGIPAAFVKRAFVEKLIAPKKLEDLQVLMAHGQAQSFPIPGATGTLKVNVERQTAPTRNVLGYLEGRDPKLKNEVVVIGAHYDHLGMGDSHSLSSSREPAIHHGADDNASGTAGVLELAQYFAAHRERLGRSVLFMTFSGEELGLLGSNYWTKKPTIPLGRVAAMINLDMIGRMRNDSVEVLGGGSSPAWSDILDAVNKRYHLTLKGAQSSSTGFGGSDQQSFYAKNIPVLFFFTGVHPDYHKPSDTWDKINSQGEAKILHFVADTVERVSKSPAHLQFVRAKEAEQSPGPGFRVYLGTIPDYAEEVEGVLFQGVREGSPAEKGGIRGGDILVEFGGKKIRNVQEYTTVLSDAKPDVPVTVAVLRKGQRVTLTVTPAARH